MTALGMVVFAAGIIVGWIARDSRSGDYVARAFLTAPEPRFCLDCRRVTEADLHGRCLRCAGASTVSAHAVRTERAA